LGIGGSPRNPSARAPPAPRASWRGPHRTGASAPSGDTSASRSADSSDGETIDLNNFIVSHSEQAESADRGLPAFSKLYSKNDKM